MSRALSYILFIQLSLFAFSSASQADENSRAFFRGLVSRGLGDANWNDPIVNFVNSSNFNIQNLLKANEILFKNAQTHNATANSNWQALGEITITFGSLLDALFPIVSFSLRVDGINRLIPPQYKGVFNVLNRTFATYANEANLPAILSQESHLTLLLTYHYKQQFFLAGESLEDLTEKILNGAEALAVNFQIDIDLSNASKIIEENYHADELLIGLLTGLSSELALSEGLLTHINSTLFNQHKILGSFNVLSQNSFNFSANGKDEEEFTENVGQIAYYLKNAKDMAQQYGNAEAVNKLTFAFNLFNEHSKLLQSIQVALHQQIDLRKYFKEMYNDGEINGNYEEAGKAWARVCSILNNRNNRLGDSQVETMEIAVSKSLRKRTF